MQPSVAIVGRGRLGSALAHALGAPPPLGRGADPQHADVVLLCVPDGAIDAAAARVTRREGLLVGHCSGARPLGGLDLSLHPLMTVTGPGAPFAGAGCAIAGATDHALATARALAVSLGMEPFVVPDADRAAYHAGASVASNFLVTLEEAAGGLLGRDRRLLVPLVRQTVENWARDGRAALTGPIARGDEETVARQRAAVAERSPEHLALFDALAAATRRIAA